MTERPSSTTPAIGMILLSCISLQFGAALAVQLFGPVGSWGVTALRLGIAAVVMLVIVRPRVLSWSRAQWQAVLLFGLSVGAMNGTFYAALSRIPMGTAVSLEFLGPLVLSALLSRRRTDLACVALALVGVSLFGLESLSGTADLDPLGVALALLAGVFWGSYVLTSARVGRLVPGHGGLAAALVVATTILLPLGASGIATAVADPRLLLIAAGIGVLSSVIPYSLEISALRRLPRHVFGILLSLEPVVATIAGLVLLGQGISIYSAAAVVLVVAASVGITLNERTSSRPEIVPSEIVPVPDAFEASAADTPDPADEDALRTVHDSEGVSIPR